MAPFQKSVETGISLEAAGPGDANKRGIAPQMQNSYKWSKPGSLNSGLEARALQSRQSSLHRSGVETCKYDQITRRGFSVLVSL